MIKAEAHSDDRASEVQFDATPWFEAATDQEIEKLAAAGWGGDYPADEVAMQMADSVDGLADMFKYIEIAHKIRDVGFECHVDSDSALAWLKLHRFALWEQLKEE